MHAGDSSGVNWLTNGPFRRHDDAKRAGWFSRRHRTSDAHRTAQDKRQARLDNSYAAARARQVAADERKAAQKEAA